MDLPGMNLNFSGVPMRLAPTKGRTLDHVGFEVKDLEAFCRRLVAAGITLDRPYAIGPDGVATALLTDPWGTSLELTEGLDRWK
jgi:catechol 2,3-dioxygenase-like lactoylglutathione lyase family enzyme